MDNIRFPIAESIDDLLRYGVSGGVLLIYLLIAFPEIFCPNKFGWQYFVIFSFIIGFLLFIIIRCIVDHFEGEDYYKGVVGKFIESKFGKKDLPVHLSRALENYYFWKDDKRVYMSKIYRRASYIYFYLSMAIIFFSGAAFLLISSINEEYGQKLSFLSFIMLVVLFFILCFILTYKLSEKLTKFCENQEKFVTCLLPLLFLLLLYSTILYTFYKEILPYGIISMVVSFILSYIFYCKFDSTYEDQKYFVKVAFLNELYKFIRFVGRIRRINNSNPINHGTKRIIPELDDP